MQYTDKIRIEAFLDRPLTANELVNLTENIEYISGQVANYCAREWLDVGEDGDDINPEERLFDGEGGKEIFIDDFSDLTKVELLDSQGNLNIELTDDDEFVLYPLNKAISESIFLRNYRFPCLPASVRVTAKFNSGVVPSGVVQAVTSMLAGFISNKTSTSGFKKESIEGYSYEVFSGKDFEDNSKNLLKTLDSYKKLYL